MQAPNALIKVDDEHLAESVFTHFRCPAEIVVPYHIHDPEATNVFYAYVRSRFVSSIWNMDSPWMVSMYGTLALNLVGFMLLSIVARLLPGTKVFAFGFTMLASSMLLAIPIIYATLVTLNLSGRYGKLWWRKLLGPTHVGITELGFKLYVRGKFFYNYPNLAVWKDISEVGIVNDSLYNVPAITYRLTSNYTFRNVILPITGFSSESHLHIVLNHLSEHVDKVRITESFATLAKADFKPLLEQYRQLTTVPTLETQQ